jgi:hypothetical protein
MKGIYEYKYKDGDEARWEKMADGGVRYSCQGNLVFSLSSSTWNKLVSSMSDDKEEPLTPHDTLGEITAYRVWKLNKNNLLSSLFRDRTPWYPNTPMTGHVGKDSDASGIYSFRDKNHALNLLSEHAPGAYLGSVSLWGEVVEHENGYRSEYASITSLDIAGDAAAAKKLDSLRARYNVAGTGNEALSYSKTKHIKNRLLPLAHVGFGILVIINMVFLITNVLDILSSPVKRESVQVSLAIQGQMYYINTIKYGTCVAPLPGNTYEICVNPQPKEIRLMPDQNESQRRN